MSKTIQLLKENRKIGFEYLKCVIESKIIEYMFRINGAFAVIAENIINKHKRKYSNLLFFLTYQKNIDWDHPRWLDEKINKLECDVYYKDENVIKCADKYAVRGYVKEKGLADILTHIYSEAENVEELNLSALPERFVIKKNNDCGGVEIFDNKEKCLRLNDKLKDLSKKTSGNYGIYYGEYHYQYMIPHYYIEEYLGTIDGKFPYDYKFFCMNGIPSACLVCIGREDEHNLLRFLVNPEFELLDFMPDEKKVSAEDIKKYKPNSWDELLNVSAKLSKEFPFVRVDLYDIDGKVVFGEMTFTPMGGRNYYFSEKGQLYLGSLLEI